MTVVQLTPRALYEEVAERLRTRIFSHELTPGSWIDEQALAAEYGISRTPLREALKVLAAEGLVTMKVRRGCYVTEVSRRDLEEIFTVLSLLEGQAARVVAEQAQPEDLAKLQTMHAQLETHATQGDLEGFFQVNQAFHQAILDIAGNHWMSSVIHDLRKVLKLNRHNSLYKEGRLHQSLQEHRQIMAAMQQHDGAAAQESMRIHLLNGREAASI